MERSSGILLPIFSLPGKYGIGTLGKEAREFADFLHAAGQRWWQILPVGPTGDIDSPYTSESTFAGNPLLIDPELLAKDGLLTEDELAHAVIPEGNINYPLLRVQRDALLRKAYRRWKDHLTVKNFAREHPWVQEYALYRAAKLYFDGRAWYDWPDEALRAHEPAAVEQWQMRLAPEIAFQCCVQFWFFRQWEALKKYVNSLELKIIGDLPIYVSLDSADVWSERKEFLLDQDGKPSKVAGVPPDYFSEEGQLWGNPLYNWPAMKADGFGWWIRRVEGASALFDAIRIDHFRGLASYWAVPATSTSAKIGAWEKGPGMDLLRVLTSWFPHITYIAEDLGILTDEVHELRKESGLPGMKVLEFAFTVPSNAYLPHNYDAHCICYTGTHDNNTVLGWYDQADEKERAFVKQYLGVDRREDICRALLRCGQRSVAELFVAQIQDYLELGAEARINVPGVADNNWRWRMPDGKLTAELAANIHDMCVTFGRAVN